MDYRVFRYYKLLSAFDQYFLLEVHETFCLELALNGECELDDILSLLQVCAVNLTIRLNVWFHFYIDFQSCRGNGSTRVFISKLEQRCRILLDEAIAKSLLVNTRTFITFEI